MKNDPKVNKPKRWSITSDKFLDPEQVESLLRYLNEKRDLAIARNNDFQSIRDFYAIRCLLETGLREFEFCAVQHKDFCGQKLNVRLGKGGKPRTVLLTKSTAYLLREWVEIKVQLGLPVTPDEPLFPSRTGGHYSTRGIRRRIKDAFKALGFPDSLSGHALRHTNCSMLIETKKVSLTRVRDNLGHHSLSVTNLYAHATGNLDDVELYPTSASALSEKSDPRDDVVSKKSNDPVKAFLRKRTLKGEDQK